MKRFALILFVMTVVAIGCESDELFFERTEILGTWNVTENSSEFGVQYYDVVISADPVDNNKVLISNFYGLGETIYGITNADFAINIPGQDAGSYTISGQGIVNDKYTSIEWSYTVSDGSGNPDDVTATYSPSATAVTNDSLLEY